MSHSRLLTAFRKAPAAVAILGLFIAIAYVSSARDCHADTTEPYELVNHFIGTEPLTDPAQIGYTPPKGWRVWAGFTFPGAALPHAMVQCSPVTTFVTGSGYYYEDDVINGFTHSNKGHWNLCNISIMPVVTRLYIRGSGDRLGPWNARGYGSHFSHENEFAEPGYYRVHLDDYDTDVELTSTLRTGFHRYTFPESVNSFILFDMEKANQRVQDAYIEIVDDTTVRGWQSLGHEVVYFHAEFDTPFYYSGTWNGYASHERKDGKHVEKGVDIGAYLKYKTTEGQVVQVKVGLSWVSMENAKMNLDAENPGWDFDAVKRNSERVWKDFLNSVEVEGGTPRERELFYTSLYHAVLWPALRSDVDGSFTGADGKTDKADYNYYVRPSFWDTFRNKLPLLTILEPKVKRDIIKSCIDMGQKSGFMPSFFHGDHAASMVAGSYIRGLTDFDVEEAYRLLVKNATQVGGPRGNNTFYNEHGYVPTPYGITDEELLLPPAGGSAGVTKTLEYSYDDYSIALLAKKLGKTDDYKKFYQRGQNYRNVYHFDSNFMRGKWENGEWATPFKPDYPWYGYMYRETTGWQSTFYVPHDVQGLIDIMGGKDRYIAKLDSLFVVPWNPDHIARNTCCFIGQYSHGNQPAHQAPFMYNYAGAPWKTQRIVRKILDVMYNVGDNGLALPGMDDAGEMSSWYVFSAMGFYPVAPSTPNYVVASPVFDKVTIHLPDYLYGGSDFTIVANNASPDNIYIDSSKLNGRKNTKSWFSHDEFKNGSTIEFDMIPYPNPKWGAGKKDVPPVVK